MSASFKTPNALGYCNLHLKLLYFLKLNLLNYKIKFKRIMTLNYFNFKVITLFMSY